MGNQQKEDLKSLDESTFLSVFEGVPKFNINLTELKLDVADILAEKTNIFSSKGEVRRMIKSNAISVNKEKISQNFQFEKIDLLSEKIYIGSRRKKLLSNLLLHSFN